MSGVFYSFKEEPKKFDKWVAKGKARPDTLVV